MASKSNEKKKNIIITIISIFIIISSFIIASAVLYNFVLKPQNTYNIATELLDNGSYEQAKQQFEKIDNFKDSADKIALCDEKLNGLNNEKQISQKDIVNSAYYNVVADMISSVGNASVQKDALTDYDSYEVAGVCLVKLIDFNNDGQDELVVGYNDKINNVMAYDVYAYINNNVCKIVDKIEPEYAGQDIGYISFEFYKENGVTYLYKWNKTCYLDDGFLKSFDGEKFVDYKEWCTKENDELDIDCYVDNKEVDDEYYLSMFPHYEVDMMSNDNYVPLEKYHNEGKGMDIYAFFFLSKNAANELVNDVNENIGLLKHSFDIVNK